jgi:abhydrolase domain-containing protein 17
VDVTLIAFKLQCIELLILSMKHWQTWIIGHWSWQRILRLPLIAYGTIALYAYFCGDRQLFQPHPASYRDTPDLIRLSTPNGQTISAQYLTHAAAQYTILYSHGNAQDLGDIRPILEDLRGLKFNILAYDYRGYGTSQGTPSEANAYQDIQTAYRFLTQHHGIKGDRIILLGQSIGSGPSVYLATQQPIAGLIIQSGFVSAFRIVVPFPLLPFDKFPNGDRISQVHAPVLVVHGTTDQLIPFWQAKALYGAANQPKDLVPIQGAGHNDVNEIGGKQYLQRIQTFAQSLSSP